MRIKGADLKKIHFRSGVLRKWSIMNGVSIEVCKLAFLIRSGFDIQQQITLLRSELTKKNKKKKNTEICKDYDTMNETLESLA